MVGETINACLSPQEWLAGWQGLAVLALIISYLLVSLYYMLGKMIGAPGITARAKNEFYQTFMTTIMAVFLVGLIPFLCVFNLQDAGIAKSGNLFDIASFYAEWLVHKNMAVLSQVIFWNNVMAVATSVGMGISVYGISVMNSPFSGFAPLGNAVNVLMSSVMIACLVSFAQFVLLKFVYAGMFNVLLPVGIVCRAFPFTREFGGALIAIAVGFFVFYPLLLNIDYVIIGQPTSMPESGVELHATKWYMFVEDLAMFGFTHWMESQVQETFGPGLIGGTASVIHDLSIIFRFVRRVIDIYVELVTGGVATILIGSFLLPALNGVVLVSVVRDLSRMLGTEVDISTLTRMI